MTISPPFRLATTSFIYPDRILPNVEKLGPVFDEIELLVFESAPEKVLPSADEIRTLAAYKERFDLTFNVHLPLDISLTDPEAEKRKSAVDTIIRIMELCSPLTPSTYTLHLDFHGSKTKPADIETFRQSASESLDRLAGSISDPGLVSVETLEYPFSYAAPLVEKYNLSVCADIGHLVKYGYSVRDFFGKWARDISIVHLHGVDFSTTPPKDHVSLDRLPDPAAREIMDILSQFTGVVSLEVFNREHLDVSLDFLSRRILQET
ncbi:MAG: sugar phosphate isomerase/epimerase [Desulfarculaceae bacterium]|nr:sugar phosphate isomerase/epimerase [Desulfarculaceae bacterium]